MGLNTNTWNRIRYTFYAPIYDLIASYFKKSRRKSIHALNIGSGESVLIVGAGTGLDLEFLPPTAIIVATDITPAMVVRIKKRSRRLSTNVEVKVMDGQSLEFQDDTFDYVILHLILAVIPDPAKCLHEAERVLKSGGQVAVFDKFLGDYQKASLLRRVFNLFTNILFSSITRDFARISEKSQLRLASDEEADFNGNFRIIRLVKD